MDESVPGRLESKPKRSYGCTIVFFCMGLTVVGVLLMIIFKPDVAVKEVKLNPQETTQVLVDNVSPDTFNMVVVELYLLGKRYHVRTHTSPGSGSSRRTTSRTNHLAYRVPITVKIIRVRDGAVILEHDHIFEIDDFEKSQLSNKKLEFEELGVTVRNYPDVPEIDQEEELRVELTIHKDTDYESRVQTGKLVLEKKGKSFGMSIGIMIVIFSALVGTLVTTILVVKFLFMTILKSNMKKYEDIEERVKQGQ